MGLPSVRELRTQGLVSLVREPVGEGCSLWRPRIRFRTRPFRQCPFLLNDVDPDGRYRGLCSLHPDDKPLVCSLAPLAREVEDPGTGPFRVTWSFIPPVEGCPGVGLGPVLDLAAPVSLADRLDREADWMRWLVGASPGWTDEDQAWAGLDNKGRSH